MWAAATCAATIDGRPFLPFGFYCDPEFGDLPEVRRALASGQSLDVLGLQGGDELQIGRPGAGFAATFAVITGVVGLTTTVILLTRH